MMKTKNSSGICQLRNATALPTCGAELQLQLDEERNHREALDKEATEAAPHAHGP